MTRILSAIALACLVGTIGLSAQMKHVDLKDAKGNTVGMAMISPAKGGGVSIDLDLKGLPPGEHAHSLPRGAEVRGAVHERRRPLQPGQQEARHAEPRRPARRRHDELHGDAKGTAKTTITNKNVTMGAGANSIYAAAAPRW